MYGTLEDANTYFENRLHVDAWDEATDDNKIKALEESQKRIDLLNFKGNSVTEGIVFPRYYGDEADGTEETPEVIKIANYECAFALLDGVDPEFEQENLAVSSESYSGVSTSYSRSKYLPEHLAAGIPSAYAWRFLLQYLKTPGSVTIYRV
jgi:hypothetical protein